MLLCMMLLGWQFCFPAAAQFTFLNPSVDVVSLGTKDPAAPDGKPVVHCDLEVPVLSSIVLRTPFCVHTPLPPSAGDDDRKGIACLPITGLQPSAP